MSLFWRIMWALIRWRNKTYRSQYSGERTKRILTFHQDGKTYELCQHVNPDGTVPYTAKEIESMAVTCANCGGLILPYTWVQWFVPEDEKSFHAPQGAYFEPNKGAWLGCPSPNCGNGLLVGVWLPSEKNPQQCEVVPCMEIGVISFSPPPDQAQENGDHH